MNKQEIKELIQKDFEEAEKNHDLNEMPMRAYWKGRMYALKETLEYFKGGDDLYCEKHKKAFICDGNMVFYCPDCVKDVNKLLMKDIYKRE